jgi:hypothetical protein
MKIAPMIAPMIPLNSAEEPSQWKFIKQVDKVVSDEKTIGCGSF